MSVVSPISAASPRSKEIENTKTHYRNQTYPGTEKRINGSMDGILASSRARSQTNLSEIMSLRTFIQLETPPVSDSDGNGSNDDCLTDVERETTNSPMSDRTPPLNPGSRWARFFPELSTHFSLVSPINTALKDSPAVPFPLQAEFHDGNGCSVSSQSALPKTRSSNSSSSFSDDIHDSASSCYSRRSSLTSLGSEYIGSGYKSADAFSIASPVAAGVFDDSASVRHAPTGSIRKQSSIAEVKNKPLPQEPPILLSPLSVRRKTPLPLQRQRSRSSNNFPNRAISKQPKQPKSWQRHHPTFSQAAEDLEDVLAKITSQDFPSESPSSEILDSPLQISRGDMRMIPSRPAPKPPVPQPTTSSPNVADRQASDKFAKEGEAKQPKKNTKPRMPFFLSVPGFSRKQGRPHIRSLSSSTLRSEVESPTLREHQASGAKEYGDEIAELPGSLGPENTQRPSSWCSERELRLKLPRLQTRPVDKPAQADRPIPSATTEKSTGSESQRSSQPQKPHEDYENVFEEKIFVSSSKVPSRRSSTRYALPYQMGPIQLPGIIYELDACPAPAASRSLKPVSLGSLPVNAPDNVVLMIMRNADSLDDLFNLAVINKHFYSVFKKQELSLIKNTVFKMSPPAWELREMSPPWNSEWQSLLDPDAQVPEYTPTIYLRRYAQDIFTLAQLKCLILARCGTFLRQETVRGLAGVDIKRAAEIDDAFWRIWTFCRIFGCAKGRENDILGQIDWLNGGVMAMSPQNSAIVSVSEPFGMNNVLFEPPPGFGQGNSGGLSQNQLYDMTEIWTCLGVLLQPVHEKRAEARQVGIFRGHDVRSGDSAKEESILEEWTAYALTLGLSAALCLSSICPIKNATEVFVKAQSIGLTKWELCDSGTTRSSFLKEALSKAYKARETGLQSKQQMRLSDIGTWSSASSTQDSRSSGSSIAGPDDRQRQGAFADELRNQQPQRRNPGPRTFAEERPISSYTMIMNHLEGVPHQRPPLPTPAIQTSHYTTTNVGGFHTPHHYIPQPVMPTFVPQVLDPVDRAIDMMVHELGFEEKDAKWALKITDTGEGIDVNAAVSLLYTEQKRRTKKQRFARKPKQGSLLTPFMNGDKDAATNWRWA